MFYILFKCTVFVVQISPVGTNLTSIQDISPYGTPVVLYTVCFYSPLLFPFILLYCFPLSRSHFFLLLYTWFLPEEKRICVKFHLGDDYSDIPSSGIHSSWDALLHAAFWLKKLLLITITVIVSSIASGNWMLPVSSLTYPNAQLSVGKTELNQTPAIWCSKH